MPREPENDQVGQREQGLDGLRYRPLGAAAVRSCEDERS